MAVLVHPIKSHWKNKPRPLIFLISLGNALVYESKKSQLPVHGTSLNSLFIVILWRRLSTQSWEFCLYVSQKWIIWVEKDMMLGKFKTEQNKNTEKGSEKIDQAKTGDGLCEKMPRQFCQCETYARHKLQCFVKKHSLCLYQTKENKHRGTRVCRFAWARHKRRASWLCGSIACVFLKLCGSEKLKRYKDVMKAQKACGLLQVEVQIPAACALTCLSTSPISLFCKGSYVCAMIVSKRSRYLRDDICRFSEIVTPPHAWPSQEVLNQAHPDIVSPLKDGRTQKRTNHVLNMFVYSALFYSSTGTK